MAHTAREGDDTVEFFDSPEVVDEKVTKLAEWIRQASHFISFTGAGISTAAGIPDFRSGMHTVLETGPGAWELRAKGKKRSSKRKVVSTVQALPTPTHMMMLQLCQNGILKGVISQNTDGLHRRSGLHKQELFELHGNSNLEVCRSCHREYLRDFRTRSAAKVHDHLTGRNCDDPHCRGKLKDTIINFGEDLPEDVLEKSFEHGEKADLCLAMGSSLTVTPAADIPKIVGKKGNVNGGLVIVNLQKTPLDRRASLKIHAKCEDVSRLLMDKLGLSIPEFRLQRKLLVTQKTVSGSPNCKVSIQGMSSDDFPFSFISKVDFTSGAKTTSVSKEPFQVITEDPKKIKLLVKFRVYFFGHYGEPPLDFEWPLQSMSNASAMYVLEFNPFTQTWANPVIENDTKVTDVTAKLQAAAL